MRIRSRRGSRSGAAGRRARQVLKWRSQLRSPSLMRLHHCRRRGGARGVSIGDAMAIDIEHMASGRCKEERKATRVARERLVIAGDGTDDLSARGRDEIDMQDVLGAQVLATPQTCRQ